MSDPMLDAGPGGTGNPDEDAQRFLRAVSAPPQPSSAYLDPGNSSLASVIAPMAWDDWAGLPKPPPAPPTMEELTPAPSEDFLRGYRRVGSGGYKVTPPPAPEGQTYVDSEGNPIDTPEPRYGQAFGDVLDSDSLLRDWFARAKASQIQAEDVQPSGDDMRRARDVVEQTFNPDEVPTGQAPDFILGPNGEVRGTRGPGIGGDIPLADEVAGQAASRRAWASSPVGAIGAVQSAINEPWGMLMGQVLTAGTPEGAQIDQFVRKAMADEGIDPNSRAGYIRANELRSQIGRKVWETAREQNPLASAIVEMGNPIYLALPGAGAALRGSALLSRVPVVGAVLESTIANAGMPGLDRALAGGVNGVRALLSSKVGRVSIAAGLGLTTYDLASNADHRAMAESYAPMVALLALGLVRGKPAGVDNARLADLLEVASGMGKRSKSLQNTLIALRNDQGLSPAQIEGAVDVLTSFAQHAGSDSENAAAAREIAAGLWKHAEVAVGKNPTVAEYQAKVTARAKWTDPEALAWSDQPAAATLSPDYVAKVRAGWQFKSDETGAYWLKGDGSVPAAGEKPTPVLIETGRKVVTKDGQIAYVDGDVLEGSTKVTLRNEQGGYSHVESIDDLVPHVPGEDVRITAARAKVDAAKARLAEVKVEVKGYGDSGDAPEVRRAQASLRDAQQALKDVPGLVRAEAKAAAKTAAEDAAYAARRQKEPGGLPREYFLPREVAQPTRDEFSITGGGDTWNVRQTDAEGLTHEYATFKSKAAAETYLEKFPTGHGTAVEGARAVIQPGDAARDVQVGDRRIHVPSKADIAQQQARTAAEAATSQAATDAERTLTSKYGIAEGDRGSARSGAQSLITGQGPFTSDRVRVMNALREGDVADLKALGQSGATLKKRIKAEGVGDAADAALQNYLDDTLGYKGKNSYADLSRLSDAPDGSRRYRLQARREVIARADADLREMGATVEVSAKQPLVTRDITMPKDAAALVSQRAEGTAGQRFYTPEGAPKPDAIADALLRGEKLPPEITRSPEVAQAVNATVKRTVKSDGTSDLFTPEQLALRRGQATVRMLGEQKKLRGEPRADKHADIVLGQPGSGKSNLVSQDLLKAWKAWELDPDAAKALLPEYRDGLTADAVHEESSRIFEDALVASLNRGSNVVLPLVGKNPERITGLISTLKAKGYRVDVHYVHATEEQSIARTLGRFKETGRWLDPKYIRSVDGNPRKTYDSVKELTGRPDGPDSIRFIDNSGKRGEAHVVPENGAGTAAEQPGRVRQRGGRGAESGQPREGLGEDAARGIDSARVATEGLPGSAKYLGALEAALRAGKPGDLPTPQQAKAGHMTPYRLREDGTIEYNAGRVSPTARTAPEPGVKSGVKSAPDAQARAAASDATNRKAANAMRRGDIPGGQTFLSDLRKSLRGEGEVRADQITPEVIVDAIGPQLKAALAKGGLASMSDDAVRSFAAFLIRDSGDRNVHILTRRAAKAGAPEETALLRDLRRSVEARQATGRKAGGVPAEGGAVVPPGGRPPAPPAREAGPPPPPREPQGPLALAGPSRAPLARQQRKMTAEMVRAQKREVSAEAARQRAADTASLKLTRHRNALRAEAERNARVTPIEMPAPTGPVPKPERAPINWATEIFDFPRAMRATADVSVLFRQALIPLLSNAMSRSPERRIIARDAFRNAFKGYGRAYADATWLKTQKDPMFQQWLDRGGFASEIGEHGGAQRGPHEEFFQSQLAERLWGIGKLTIAAERSYSLTLNSLRFASWKEAVVARQRVGRPMGLREQEAYARAINVFTGRGSLGPLEASAPFLNKLFFAPRFAISRFQAPFEVVRAYRAGYHELARREATDLVKVVGAGITFLKLAEVAGFDTGADPTSSNFGKVGIGRTVVDIWGGFQQPAVFVSRLLLDQSTSASGKTHTLSQAQGSQTDADSVIWNLIKSKLGPTPSTILALIEGKNYIGEPFGPRGGRGLGETAADVAGNMLIPISWVDVWEAIQADIQDNESGKRGLPPGTIGALQGAASLTGIGVQTKSTPAKAPVPKAPLPGQAPSPSGAPSAPAKPTAAPGSWW